jgi:hypothetical protein
MGAGKIGRKLLEIRGFVQTRVLRSMVLSIIFGTLLMAEGSKADGMFVWRGEADLLEPEQRAVLYFDHGSETLLLQVASQGARTDFGWLVPLPSKPTVSVLKDDELPFEELSRSTQGGRNLYRGLGPGAAGVQEKPVTVLERQKLGMIDVAILAANDAASLESWLKRHQFKVPDGGREVLKTYVDKGWCLTALRIRAAKLRKMRDAGDSLQQLPTLRFRFDAEKPVYPLEISSRNSGFTELLVYTLGPETMDLSPAGAQPGMQEEALPDLAVMDFTPSGPPSYQNLGLRRSAAALGLSPSAQVFVGKWRGRFQPGEIKADLLFDSLSPHDYALRRIDAAQGTQALRLKAAYAHLDPQWAMDLASADWIGGYVEAARSLDASAPQSLFRKLAKNENAYVRYAIAKNINTGGDILATLAGDKDALVRADAVLNASFPTEKLVKLAADKDKQNRLLVLRNPHAPAAALRQMFGDTDTEVVCALGAHVNMTGDLLSQWLAQLPAQPKQWLGYGCVSKAELAEALSRDPSPFVRQGPASNPELSDESLRRLTRDPEGFVRGRCASNPHLPPEALRQLLKDPDFNTRDAVAWSPILPRWAVEELAKDSRSGVRMSLAVNRAVPVDILRHLSKDLEAQVRGQVCYNPNATEEMLRGLAQDPVQDVRDKAAEVLKRRGYSPAPISDVAPNTSP